MRWQTSNHTIIIEKRSVKNSAFILIYELKFSHL
nr:MAG TPA: hypothetical protein [Caudoviricetes sp.]